MASRKRSFKIQALIVILLASVLACNLSPFIPAPAVSAAPYDVYVATTGNDGNDCRTAARACRTLTEAVRKSVAGGTIMIGAGTFLEASAVTLTMPLTLLGAARDRTILSARGGGILVVSGHDGQVILRDLTVTGNIGTVVPAIAVQNGGTLTLERVTVRDNPGIGITVTSGTVSLNDCLVSGNLEGIENRAALQVINSIFRSNRTFALNNYGVAALDRSTLDLNGTAARPGIAGIPAIENHKLPDALPEETGILSITGSTISNSPGTGLLIDSGRVTIFSSSILTNENGIVGWNGFLRLGGSVIAGNRGSGLRTLSDNAGSPLGAEITQTAILRNRIGIEILTGSVRIENTTLSGNTVAGIQLAEGNLTLTYSTVAYNTGAGVSFAAATGGSAYLSDSIVNLNAAGRDCTDISRISLGGTHYACDAAWNARLHLGPLSPEGGTFVHPLQAGSQAVDQYTSEPCPAVDQRGYSRPAGAQCDIGAYEFGAGLHLEAATPGIETPTATPGVITIFTFTAQANCRLGPNTLYDSVGFGQIGQQARIEGISDPAGWYYVQLPDTLYRCFVAGSTGTVTGPVDGLSVIPAPPLPVAPAAPVLNVSNQICDSKQYVVRLSWKEVKGEDGYRVYRDGALIATLGSGVVFYDDLSPDYNPHEYYVEAFNAVGATASTKTKSPGCTY